MQITHQEAHTLVQFNADNALNLQEKITLSTHLADCSECRVYAEEIQEVESLLLPIMKKQWSLQPAPLSTATIHVKRNSKIQTSIALATRTLAIGAVLAALIFSVWQFRISGTEKTSPVSMSVPPIPTPSTQSTSTKIMFQNCAGVLYTVRENDTLESIASQFTTSKQELMTANYLQTESINTGMELIVPVCHFTPTGTIHPATLTTTYTPSISPTTYTPDG